MFTRTLSEPNAPAAASPQAAAEGIRATGAAVSGALKFGGEVYGGYRELDIESSIEAGRAVREEAFQSNERAFIQQQDYIAAQKRIQDEQTKLVSLQGTQGPLTEERERIVLESIASSEGALTGFKTEAERLREAYKAGMSNAEYFTRIAAITKKAIAKYPALSDQIRQQMSKVSGLPGADEFASFSYIQRSFGGGGGREQKETGGYSKEDYKVMADASGLLVGDITAMQIQDPVGFAQVAAKGRSAVKSKQEKEFLQQTLDIQASSGTLAADENRPMFQLLARMNMSNGISELLNKKPEILNTFYQQLAGSAPAPDQIVTANDMFKATVKQSLDSQKAITMMQIDAYSKQGMPVQKRDEIKKLVQEEYDNMLALYLDPSASMAVASVMKNHMDKSSDKKMKLLELSIAQMNALTGTKVKESWFSGDVNQRQVIKRNYPELAKWLEDGENAVISVSTDVRSMLKATGELKVVEAVSNDARKTSEATPTEQRTRLTDQVVSSLAEGALDRYKKDKKPKPEDVNALSTFLSNANNGAGFPTLRANETVIRDFMAGVTEQEKPAVFRAVEKSYSRELQSRVLEWERVSKKEGWDFPVVFTSDGKVQLVNNREVRPSPTGTLTNVPAQGQPSIYASAEEWAQYREAQAAGTAGSQRVEDPQYLLANSYFNATIAPRIIASTLVRSVVTGEQKAVAAKVASDALNDKKFSNYMPFMAVSTAGAGRGGQGGPTAEELSVTAPTGIGGQQSPATGATLVDQRSRDKQDEIALVREIERAKKNPIGTSKELADGVVKILEEELAKVRARLGNV